MFAGSWDQLWVVGLTLLLTAMLVLLALAFEMGTRRLLRHGDPRTVQPLAVALGSIAGTATGYGVTHVEPGEGPMLAVFASATVLFFLLAWLPNRGAGRAWIESHRRMAKSARQTANGQDDPR